MENPLAWRRSTGSERRTRRSPASRTCTGPPRSGASSIRGQAAVAGSARCSPKLHAGFDGAAYGARLGDAHEAPSLLGRQIVWKMDGGDDLFNDGAIAVLGLHDREIVGSVGDETEMPPVGPQLGPGSEQAGAAHDQPPVAVGERERPRRLHLSRRRWRQTQLPRRTPWSCLAE